MAFSRTDYLDRGRVPEGKPEVHYPSPNISDLLVVESVPIGPGKYRAIPYGTPHPDYDTNGLILTKQRRIKAANNQVWAQRIYASDVGNEDWFNYAIKYAGDVVANPIFIRTYEMLRTNYAPLTEKAPFTGIYRLALTAGGTGYTSAPTVVFTGSNTRPAAANAIMSPDGAEVIGLEMTDEGLGYATAPAVSFTGGGGSDAAATAYMQPANAILVKQEMAPHDNPDLVSLFVKVVRVYETLPGPLLIWNEYEDERGRGRRGPVKRTSQSVVAVGNEVSTFTRPSAGTARKTWFEPRGDSALVLTKFVEEWTEISVDDQEITSEFGGGILDVTERRDAPGEQTPDAGLLVVSSKLQTASPDEQVKETKRLSTSGVPTLELIDEGAGYTIAPGVSFSGGTGSGGAAHSVLGFGIASVAITNGGSGYASPPAIRFSGSGIVRGAYAVTRLGFAVASLAVTNGGSGYTSAPSVTLPGDGTAATATAVIGFAIASIVINVAGTGYTEGSPEVAIAVPGGNGSQAFAHAIVSEEGVLTAIVVDFAGSGYTTVPAVTIAPSYVYDYTDEFNPEVLIGEDDEPLVYDDSSAATATLTTTGSVTGLTLTAPGSGYTLPPAVQFGNDGDGTGAMAYAVLAATGSVKSVTVNSPGRYKTTPTVGFQGGGGTAAAGTATLAGTGSVVELVLDTPGNYTVAPTVVFTGSNSSPASGVYHLPGDAWPTLFETETDPKYGVIVQMRKRVVPGGTIYPPGVGVASDEQYVDIRAVERWRSVQIVSRIDPSTLPPNLQWEKVKHVSLPSILNFIGPVWHDDRSSEASAEMHGVATGTDNTGLITLATHTRPSYSKQTISRAFVSATARHRLGVRSNLEIGTVRPFDGYAKCLFERRFSIGPPPTLLVNDAVLRIQSVTGTATIIERERSEGESTGSDLARIASETDVSTRIVSFGPMLSGSFATVNMPTHGERDVNGGAPKSSTTDTVQVTNTPNGRVQIFRHYFPRYSQPVFSGNLGAYVQNNIGRSALIDSATVTRQKVVAEVRLLIPASSPLDFSLNPADASYFVIDVDVEAWRLGIYVTEITRAILPVAH